MLISYKNGYLSWKDYSNGTLYTEDGGATWHIATYTKTNEFFPLGNRATDYYWSPTNENYIINLIMILLVHQLMAVTHFIIIQMELMV